MNKPKIGLDVDDVLAAFYVAYALRHNKPLNPVDIWAESWIIEKMKDDSLDDEFWLNLPVYTPASKIDFEVDCYISTLDPKFYNARKEWLSRNGFPEAPLFLTKDKLSVIKERDLDYFIDDKYATIKMIEDSTLKCKGVQFIPCYHDFKIIGRHILFDMENFTTHILNKHE